MPALGTPLPQARERRGVDLGGATALPDTHFLGMGAEHLQDVGGEQELLETLAVRAEQDEVVGVRRFRYRPQSRPISGGSEIVGA